MKVSIIQYPKEITLGELREMDGEALGVVFQFGLQVFVVVSVEPLIACAFYESSVAGFHPYIEITAQDEQKVILLEGEAWARRYPEFWQELLDSWFKDDD